MTDLILLNDSSPAKPSLTARFKSAADIAGLSVYVVAPLVVAFGMTLPGHAGAALVVPLLGAGLGIIGAAVMPAVSATLGLIDMRQAFGRARSVPVSSPDANAEMSALENARTQKLKAQKRNQTVSAIAYALAALVMAGSLISIAKREGADLRNVPAGFVATLAGFYFGRRAYGNAKDAARYEAAIPVLRAKQERASTPA